MATQVNNKQVMKVLVAIFCGKTMMSELFCVKMNQQSVCEWWKVILLHTCVVHGRLIGHSAESLWALLALHCRGACSLDEQWSRRAQLRTKVVNSCCSRKWTVTVALPRSLPNSSGSGRVVGFPTALPIFGQEAKRRSNLERAPVAPQTECCAATWSQRAEYRVQRRVLD